MCSHTHADSGYVRLLHDILYTFISPFPSPHTHTSPDHVPYVLVGAGTASFAAAKAIRKRDPTAKILIIGEESYSPYSRPPLSKQLWLSEDHESAKDLKFKASWTGDKLVE